LPATKNDQSFGWTQPPVGLRVGWTLRPDAQLFGLPVDPAGAAWSFGPVGILPQAVERSGMEARLTPRRLLVCAAALTTLVALTSGCGGGSEARAGSTDASLLKYSNSVLSFTYPAAWTAYPSRSSGELHFHPLVFLSTQALHDPCSTHGNTTSCGFPVRHLQPGGVLAFWQVSGMPATGLGPGSRVKVGGLPAARSDAAGGACRRIGADRTVDVAVQTSGPLPSPLTYFTACLRGPNLALAEKRVDALLASTKFVSH
jgi:hypothetical protein